ncbi:hypothetical protein ANO11243_010170 [Dothideomycetidae sp. 11243]|nr:hypothetical protein ANO11243_010170 [fungal sp. No.11243]
MALIGVLLTPYGVIGSVLVIALLVYRAALPKPIPGIPHHKKSLQSIWGDMPALIEFSKNSNQTAMEYVTQQALELDSPIYQLFLFPFKKPNVFITDHREGLDIMLRRQKDFDRCGFFQDVFGGVIPEHHMLMPTNDRFKAQRKLLADTMTPSFLTDVAAKHLYQQSQHLVDMWRVKAKVAGGRPFDMDDDINHFALDAIWAVAFGSEIDTIKTQRQFLEKLNSPDLPPDIDAPATLPRPQLPDAFEAIMVLSHSMEDAAQSPFPAFAHWCLRQAKPWKLAKAHKDRLVQDRLNDAKARLLNDDEANIACATDHMVFREKKAAEKEGRDPQFDSPVVKDELLGFLIAGHETTATTITWAVKLLADHPEVQERLRADFKAAYPDAVASGTLPSAEDIAAANVPFLDATMEEILRIGQTFAGQTRRARHDTEVLGCLVPRGTDVFLMANGPGFVMPDPFVRRIPESDRSVTSRETKDRTVPEWDYSDIASFKPERWIRDGEFDPNAGPSRQFGAGERGCFGRKLGLLKMRILFTLLIWSFDFPRLPEALSGYAAVAKTTRKPAQCYGRPCWTLSE